MRLAQHLVHAHKDLGLRRVHRMIGGMGRVVVDDASPAARSPGAAIAGVSVRGELSSAKRPSKLLADASRFVRKLGRPKSALSVASTDVC